MHVSKTDARNIARYLRDAAAYYAAHHTTPRECDRARLLGLMANKIERKLRDINPLPTVI